MAHKMSQEESNAYKIRSQRAMHNYGKNHSELPLLPTAIDVARLFGASEQWIRENYSEEKRISKDNMTGDGSYNNDI